MDEKNGTDVETRSGGRELGKILFVFIRRMVETVYNTQSSYSSIMQVTAIRDVVSVLTSRS